MVRIVASLALALTLSLGAAGDLDTTFGNNGIVLQNFVGSEDGLASAQDAQGRIIVVGIYRKPNLTTDIIVARFNPDGSVDTTFGNNGYVLFDKSDDDIANGVLIDPNGRILVVGKTNEDDDAYRELLVIRFNPDGSLDTTFGNGNGYITYEDTTSGGLEGFDIQLDNNKIVVAGSTIYLDKAFIARFNEDGSFDTSFATTGFTYYDTDPTQKEAVFSLVVDSDKYVMGGINQDTKRDFLLWTINKDGNSTHKFVVSPTNGDDLVMQNGSSLAKDSTGNYILVGMSDDNNDNKYDIASIVRFLPTGALDNSFGNNGIVTIPMGSEVMITSALVDGNDNIYVGGDILQGNYTDALLMRLKNDGTLDSAFGQGGKSIVQASSGNDTIYDMQLDNQQRLIAAGTGKQDNYGGSGDILLLRYETTGTPTPTPTTVSVPLGWPGKLILMASLVFLGLFARKRAF